MEVGHLPPPVAHTELRGGAALRGRLFQQSYAVWVFFLLHMWMCVFLHIICICVKVGASAPRCSEWQQGADLTAAGGAGNSGY